MKELFKRNQVLETAKQLQVALDPTPALDEAADDLHLTAWTADASSELDANEVTHGVEKGSELVEFTEEMQEVIKCLRTPYGKSVMKEAKEADECASKPKTEKEGKKVEKATVAEKPVKKAKKVDKIEKRAKEINEKKVAEKKAKSVKKATVKASPKKAEKKAVTKKVVEKKPKKEAAAKTKRGYREGTANALLEGLFEKGTTGDEVYRVLKKAFPNRKYTEGVTGTAHHAMRTFAAHLKDKGIKYSCKEGIYKFSK